LLEREGLVEAEVNKRPRVASLSIEDLEELYALRITVESLAITVSVPRFDDSDLTHLHELIDGMAETGEGRDTGRYDALHHRFHRELGKYAGARIVSDVDRLYDHATRYRQIYREQTPHAWSVAAQEHRDIVTACETGDAREAGALLSRHYARTALTVLAMIRPEHEPSLVRVALRRAVSSAQDPGPRPPS
jgi:DNA-binding GntR family transcriptional regulator